MRFNPIPLTWILAILTSAGASASGGNGVRGGSGVFCEGSPSSVVLEYFAAARLDPKLEENLAKLSPENPPVFHAALLERIPDPILRNAIARELAPFATSTAWNPSPPSGELGFIPWSVGEGTTPSSRFLEEIAARSTSGYSVLAHSVGRVFDEELDFRLPDGCELVQMAIAPDLGRLTANDRVLRKRGLPQSPSERPYLLPYGRRLKNALQMRLLEWHEAVYAVGMLDFDHPSPLLSRRLIVSALVPAAEDLRAAAANFRSYRENRERFAEGSPFNRQILRGHGVLKSSAGGNCPDLVLAVFDGVDGLVVHEAFIPANGSRVRLAHGRVKSTFDLAIARPACRFTIRRSDDEEI